MHWQRQTNLSVSTTAVELIRCARTCTSRCHEWRSAHTNWRRCVYGTHVAIGNHLYQTHNQSEWWKASALVGYNRTGSTGAIFDKELLKNYVPIHDEPFKRLRARYEQHRAHIRCFAHGIGQHVFAPHDKYLGAICGVGKILHTVSGDLDMDSHLQTSAVDPRSSTQLRLGHMLLVQSRSWHMLMPSRMSQAVLAFGSRDDVCTCRS
jgi:hypothetical protein